MRAVLLGWVALAAAPGYAIAPGANRSAPPRAVQIIAMPTAPQSQATQIDDHALETSPPVRKDPEAMAADAAFRVHDLGRLWVEFKMTNDVIDAPAAPLPATADDDPFARRPTASIATLFAQSRTRLEALVPEWMRGKLAFSVATTRYAPGCAASPYRPTGFLNLETESRRLGYYAQMSQIACAYGIPTALFDAMIIRESRYQPLASSPKNAFGLTQLMPGTAAGLGVNRYDTAENLSGGARYLRQQLDRFGQVHLALAAYNAGPGRVRNGTLPRIAETQAYVENILMNWQRLARIAEGDAPAAVHPRFSQRAGGLRRASVSTY
jgi:soluble lytic murein transglycosylase-like protein